MTKQDAILAVLERHGVKDAHAFLKSKEATAKVERSAAPDVYIRGSIPLMKGSKISREAVQRGLDRLKYL